MWENTPANLHRRHLNESQRTLAAGKIANMPVGNPKLNAKNTNAQICAISQTEAAEMLNVSRRAVQLAAKVQTEAAPEVVEAVKNGPLDRVGEGRPDLYQSVQVGVILTAIVFDCAGFCAHLSRNRGFLGRKGRVFKSYTPIRINRVLGSAGVFAQSLGRLVQP